MELVFAILIVSLSAAGLAIGLMTGRGAPRTSCEGVACIGGRRCDDCPNRGAREAK